MAADPSWEIARVCCVEKKLAGSFQSRDTSITIMAINVGVYGK